MVSEKSFVWQGYFLFGNESNEEFEEKQNKSSSINIKNKEKNMGNFEIIGITKKDGLKYVVKDEDGEIHYLNFHENKYTDKKIKYFEYNVL